eukprot:12482435-Ditylum_brightwellii.AAC.2
MAIATIKKSKKRENERAKYQIYVLGNLDPHDWIKPQYFASVMSQLEMRIMVAAAVHHNKALKAGNFKQAFCQSFLPDDEIYIV